MTKKIRFSDELVKKAEEVFAKAKGGVIRTNEGLTRGELKVLERKGIVKKRAVSKSGKYVDGGSTKSFIWELEKNYEGMIHAKANI